MQECITHFIGYLPQFIAFLKSCSIVDGVSVFHFLLGLIAISMIVGSFLHVAR